ncbi:P-loop containing nucleoside triphosphate hydrolase protein [Polychytrium aggregatum]|uniref:P-loop containing nucleoside triphosphate hydrolase protein n=1 Tax=Polychytrium aggregatum TaxID=110093 RepID=UPI0022FE793B|nr:P-loop containing nucleoside triphosphate hydrolase protein [Polychytrium aggregatum]KAI9209896.1 P-loop containing nucleoside triphosphate hydrolase protein [Polychytrium aggregatum]
MYELLADNATIRRNLDVIDRLRELGMSEERILLPTIVVVGDQSSGKSSTLESIIGIDLPKGNNIVTRNPLVLRMVRLQLEERPYAIIKCGNQPEKGLCLEPERIDNLEDIPNRIIEFTNRLSGTGSNVTANEITLTVFKHNVNDLTLIDLPGITRVPVKDQPKNIPEIIKEIIMKYIEPDESIILNVCAAHQDFSTCETIQLSRNVDPHGKRTIGVCTKVDETNTNHDIVQKILARRDTDVKLSLGWIAIRNRNQQEVLSKMSFEELRMKEKQLFTTHPVLMDLPVENYGVPELIRRLTSIQNARIRSTIPSISANIHARLKAQKEALKEMGKIVISVQDAIETFSLLLSDFLKRVRRVGFDPTGNDKEQPISKILYGLYQSFKERIRESCSKFFSDEYAIEVEREIETRAGISLPNIISDETITNLFRKEKEKVVSCIPELVHQVRLEVQTFVINQCDRCMAKSPRFCTAIKSRIIDWMEGIQARVEGILASLIETEDDVFTFNERYDRSLKLVTKGYAKAREMYLQSQEKTALPVPLVTSPTASLAQSPLPPLKHSCSGLAPPKTLASVPLAESQKSSNDSLSKIVAEPSEPPSRSLSAKGGTTQYSSGYMGMLLTTADMPNTYSSSRHVRQHIKEHSEPSKQEPSKQEQSKQEQSKQEQSKQEQSKPDSPCSASGSLSPTRNPDETELPTDGSTRSQESPDGLVMVDSLVSIRMDKGSELPTVVMCVDGNKIEIPLSDHHDRPGIFEIQATLSCYWQVFYERFFDSVIMQIRHHFFKILVDDSKLRDLIQMEFYDRDRLLQYFEAEKPIVEKYESLVKSVQRLEIAARELAKI